MNTNAIKSVIASIALVSFGIVALYAGEKWLVVLVPAAMLVWYEAKTILRSGRN